LSTIEALPLSCRDDTIFSPMAYKSIKEWPEDERPRERLIKHGAANMSDAQLLAIILRTGGGGMSALDLGMELIDKFGSLSNVENASMNELSGIKGIGKAKAAQLKAALELGRRGLQGAAPNGPAFSSGRDVHAYFHPKLQNIKQEIFYCAMLDIKNRLIMEKEVTKGLLTSSQVHPREAFSYAIREAAASVIFVHNHPSGDPTPSREDIAITSKLAEAGDIVGIPVVDHIIVADGGFTSMLEKGYLKGR
jgi:DNA repair protein RadC